jgi:DNA-directed RNA polymerase specialized sigma24 family protein
MPSQGSVSAWIAELKAGDKQAAEHLWKAYFSRLVALARHKLRGPRPAADEEDVAVSAFNSFFRAVQGRRFPRLDDRGDLWQILVMLTARKAYRLLKEDARPINGAGNVRPFSQFENEEGSIIEIIGREPTPQFAAQVVEEYRRLLDALRDKDLQAVAIAKMEGYANAEIADKLGVVERTVERRLKLIRSIWDPRGDK